VWSYHKALLLKELRQITVIGLGLLGGSVALGARRCFPRLKVVGWTHRSSTRGKARQLSVATKVADDLQASVSGSDLVILATPIYTFEGIFERIGQGLQRGCIVTDVGSTKVPPHRWARRKLPRSVHYVGSHPIAGSEQRGVEFARDDLFDRAVCVITTTSNRSEAAVRTVSGFWRALGCRVERMAPARHDRVFAQISHLPHIAAAALINANTLQQLKWAGKGFIDTSRVASGPANIWSDILLTNTRNVTKGIDRLIAELERIRQAVENGHRQQVEHLLDKARHRRSALMEYKIARKELIE